MAEPDKEPPALHDDETSEFPAQPWQTDEEWVDEINVRWRKVIENLMNGNTILDSYASAYEIEIGTPKGYNVAAASGSRLLKNAKFRDLWHKVIEEQGFNDETADFRLLDLITNPGIEPTVRRAAIHDYNELTGRIIKKTDLTSGGKPIEAPAIMPAIEPRNDAPAQTEATDGS